MKKLSAKSGELKQQFLNYRVFQVATIGRRDLPRLVRAAREQCHQHHQVRQREKPLIRLNSRRFRRSRDEPEVPAPREIAQVVDANPRKIGHLVIGENFLARFDGNHGPWPSFLSALLVPAR
jgi:hypothetical protein